MSPLTTSPYLLIERGLDGEAIRDISGVGEVPATEEALSIFAFFLDGADPASLPPGLRRPATRQFLDEAVARHMLVERVDEHRRAVFRAFERSFGSNPPRLGYIETTTRCPMDCVMCPRASEQWGRPVATMSMDLFRAVAEEIDQGEEVALHLFGDPLMDPWIFDRIDVLRRRGTKTVFSTNATLLGERLVRRLVGEGPDRLIVSCDAVTPEAYRLVRGPRASFDRAARRTEALVSAWEGAGRPFRLVLRFVNLDLNAADREEFVARWSGTPGIEVDVKDHLRFADVPPLLDQGVRRQGRLQFLLHRLGRPAPVKCLRPWATKSAELAVQVDGTVVPCCLAHSQEVTLGRLPASGLGEIWRGERFALLRTAIFFRENLEEYPLCARCNYDLP